MEPLAAVSITGAIIAITALIGLVARARTGRPRPSGRTLGTDELTEEAPAGRTTLLQFSTPTCARCPATRRLLGAIADERARLAHVEIDLAARPALADRFDVLQTPTVLVIGPDRRIHSRIGGVPDRAALERELDSLLEAAS